MYNLTHQVLLLNSYDLRVGFCSWSLLMLLPFTAKTEIYYEVCFREMKCGFSHFLGVKFPSYKQPIIELAIILITTDLCFSRLSKSQRATMLRYKIGRVDNFFSRINLFKNFQLKSY